MNAPTQPRIAFLLSSLKFGGGERVALNLAAALQAEGYGIDFLLMSREGEFLAEAEREFSVVDLRCDRTWKLPLRLMTYLRRGQPVAVISSFWKLNLCACVARLGCPRVRLILWEHSPPSRSRNSPTWLYAISASLLYRLATKVVAVSSGVAADVRRITWGLESRVITIFNPIPAPAVSHPQRLDKGGRRRILWVGRLDAPKNPGLMIESFALLPGDLGTVLEIVGDGPLRLALEQRVSELGLDGRVCFLGFREDVASLMADADLLVLSSDREGLPSVLVEALHAGLGLVATDCGEGVREVLENGRYGTLVPVRDPQAMAGAIEAELGTPVDRAVQMAGAQRFSPRLIAHQFLCALGLRVAG